MKYSEIVKRALATAAGGIIIIRPFIWSGLAVYPVKALIGDVATYSHDSLPAIVIGSIFDLTHLAIGALIISLAFDRAKILRRPLLKLSGTLAVMAAVIIGYIMLPHNI